MEKPVPKVKEPAYDWSEVETYIDTKYNKKLRDWAGKYSGKEIKTTPYQDFWHWILSMQGNIHNGCYFNLDLVVDNYMLPLETWVIEILEILNKEFPEADGCMHCWVDW